VCVCVCGCLLAVHFVGYFVGSALAVRGGCLGGGPLNGQRAPGCACRGPRGEASGCGSAARA
jgi:hypothetical protein